MLQTSNEEFMDLAEEAKQLIKDGKVESEKDKAVLSACIAYIESFNK